MIEPDILLVPDADGFRLCGQFQQTGIAPLGEFVETGQFLFIFLKGVTLHLFFPEQADGEGEQGYQNAVAGEYLYLQSHMLIFLFVNMLHDGGFIVDRGTFLCQRQAFHEETPHAHVGSPDTPAGPQDVFPGLLFAHIPAIEAEVDELYQAAHVPCENV